MARKEIVSLEDHGTWTEVEVAKATSQILPCQWVFRRKQTPDGNVKSHKAQMVARRDLEQKESFKPLVHLLLGVQCDFSWPCLSCSIGILAPLT